MIGFTEPALERSTDEQRAALVRVHKRALHVEAAVTGSLPDGFLAVRIEYRDGTVSQGDVDPAGTMST